MGEQIPVVELRLPQGGTNCHWSGAKQDALAAQFLDTAVSLSNRGVARLHLFIAAPNSMVFRLGRAYDHRNLPSALIYQYERSDDPRHPWAVLLPTHGIPAPRLQRHPAAKPD